MNKECQSNNNQPQNEANQHFTNYSDLLWQKAKTVENKKQELQTRINQLYDKTEEMRTRRFLNLAEREDLGLLEQTYWQTCAELDELSAEESIIEEYLLQVEQGSIPDKLKDMFKLNDEPKSKPTSRKKLKMTSERLRYGEVIPLNEYRNGVTTGNHRKRIKGNISPYTAESIFYQKSADTHGGKVKHGKNGSVYVNFRGVRVRK